MFKTPEQFAAGIHALCNDLPTALELIISQAKSATTVPAKLYADTIQALILLYDVKPAE